MSRRLFLSFRASDRVTGVGIRLFGLGRTDCRVAALLAMTDFVGADDSVRPVKALHPVGRDPCVPPPRQHADRTPPPSFRASDCVTGVGIRLFGLGRTDCRVAALLAMTDFVGADDSVRPVKALHPVGRDPCVPPPRQHADRTPPPSFRASDRRHWRGNPFSAHMARFSTKCEYDKIFCLQKQFLTPHG